MRKSLAITIPALALVLAACGLVSALVDGTKYAHAVETDLEEVTGMKPAVGFNWNNGHLTSVTVTFPHLYDAKPIGELADQTRAAVTKEFKQTAGAYRARVQPRRDAGVDRAGAVGSGALDNVACRKAGRLYAPMARSAL